MLNNGRANGVEQIPSDLRSPCLVEVTSWRVLTTQSFETAPVRASTLWRCWIRRRRSRWNDGASHFAQTVGDCFVERMAGKNRVPEAVAATLGAGGAVHRMEAPSHKRRGGIISPGWVGETGRGAHASCSAHARRGHRSEPRAPWRRAGRMYITCAPDVSSEGGL